MPEERSGQEPDLSLKSQTVAYLEIDPSDVERLQSMPTIVTEYDLGAIDGTYILPPILYPDGKYYLKVKHCTRLCCCYNSCY
jgi:sarcosine oxidase